MTVQTAFGKFRWNNLCWVSEHISVPLFSGATVKIQIFPEREGDKDFLKSDQVEALQRFLKLPESRCVEIIPHLWRYYQDIRETVDSDDIPAISGPSTILQHITPRFISTDRDDDGTVYISIEAECEWEIEHGLQIVLKNGERFVRVSDYSGHLTDGQAYGKKSLDDWMSDPSTSLPVRSFQEIIATLE